MAVMAAQVQASLLLLLPVVVVILGQIRRETRLDEIALWIPAAVAFDLIACLLVARLTTLEISYIVTRVAWLVGGALWIGKVRGRLVWPTALRPPQLAIIVASTLVSLLLSVQLSRDADIWDRQFHIPVVMALRAERLPFMSPFQPTTLLNYHFAGDVLASGLQTLSGARLHGSLALALAHDLVFALSGAAIGALVVAFSPARPWIVVGVLSVFFMGPMALFRTGMGNQVIGYSIMNLLSMSYRPHIVLAILFTTGVVAALISRASGRSASPRPLILFGGASLVALSSTDETSAALIAVALGATWLVYPGLFGDRRWKGAVTLAGLGVAILLAAIVFQTSLAPGGPVQVTKLVSTRWPGYAEKPVKFFSSSGQYAFLTDMGPFVLIYLGLVIHSLRRPGRLRKVLRVFAGVILLVATVAMTRLEVNGMPGENHRFATICEILFGVLGILLLAVMPATAWERLPILAGFFAAVASTGLWWENVDPPLEIFTNDVDCREALGARLFEKPEPTYVVRKQWYWYVGCHPVLAPGLPGPWVIQTGGPAAGHPALVALHQTFVRPDESLRVACPVDEPGDPVCARARLKGPCVPAGELFETCMLSPADRAALVSRPW